MKKHGSPYSSTSPARTPPQLRSPAFWMSTAPRPPARLAPHATATASSSRATSTARISSDAAHRGHEPADPGVGHRGGQRHARRLEPRDDALRAAVTPAP